MTKWKLRKTTHSKQQAMNGERNFGINVPFHRSCILIKATLETKDDVDVYSAASFSRNERTNERMEFFEKRSNMEQTKVADQQACLYWYKPANRITTIDHLKDISAFLAGLKFATDRHKSTRAAYVIEVLSFFTSWLVDSIETPCLVAWSQADRQTDRR